MKHRNIEFKAPYSRRTPNMTFDKDDPFCMLFLSSKKEKNKTKN